MTHWLTREQAAAHAGGVHPRTIDAWRRAGLTSHKIGRIVRIDRTELDAFIKALKQEDATAA